MILTPKKNLHSLVLAMLVALTTQAVQAAATAADLDAAIALYRAEGAETALPEFQRLHDEFTSSGNREAMAHTERYIGESHWRMGDYERSRVHLEQALEQFRDLGIRLGEGKTLNVLGLLEWDLGNFGAAIDQFRQASAIGEALDDRRLAGSTMNNLSLVYDELGDYRTSLDQYRQALELYEGADFPRGVSDTLGNIGGVNLLLGRFDDALGYYEQSLAISESLGLKASMTLDHGNMALCHLGLGQPDTAIEHFEIALALAGEAGMRKEEALWRRGLGNALISKGRLDLGLENHRQALSIYEHIGARGLLLDALHDMGRLHLALGDPASAENYFHRAMGLAQDIGQAQAISVNLLALGDLQLRREHHEESGALFRDALQRTTEAGELGLQAEALLRLALVHRQQQRYSESDLAANRALGIAQDTGAADRKAEALYALAESARQQHRTDEALDQYEAAQESLPAEAGADLRWQIHYGRALALVDRGNKHEAVTELESAVRIIESVRSRLREDRFKSGYVQDKYQVYTDLVRLQLELGLTHEAFSTAERLRARTFMNQLENRAPFSRNEKERLEEIALRERVRQLQKALTEEQQYAPAEQRQLAISTFSTELLEAEREYQAFLDDARRSPGHGQISAMTTPAKVQAQLEPGQALLEYVVSDENLIIFVLRERRLSAEIVALDSINLGAKINLVRELIQDPSSDSWRAPAASLSEALVLPLQDRGLLKGIRHLYLVPHGVLNYLPFALLPIEAGADGRLLMDTFTFNYLPAAASLVREPELTKESSALLAVAPARANLRFALEEARSISDMFRPDSHLLIGVGATESAFKAQSGDYRVLHLSTHGYFNSVNPLLSGLELEPDENNDGMLEVHEILRLSLGAELVTLSACDTGMGGGYFNEIPAGDDFVGLTRAFLLAGSRSVLATLWRVDDRSTVQLMEGFYRRLQEAGPESNHALALTQAQRELRQSAKYRHPFYWAAFVLVGQQNREAGA